MARSAHAAPPARDGATRRREGPAESSSSTASTAADLGTFSTLE